MNDIFTPYEQGPTRLLARLGRDHPRYTEALTLEHRLRENIAQARRYGDTETRRADRAQIIGALNGLAQETLGTSFNALCPALLPERAVDGTSGEAIYTRTPTTATIICPRCRLESPAGEHRCRNCGYEFKESQ